MPPTYANTMKILLLALLCVPSTISAQSFPKKIGRFLVKHEFATAAVVTGLSFAAESATAIHCHEIEQWCYYTPNATGLHYTPTKIAGYDALFAGGVIGFERLIWHEGRQEEANDPGNPYKHLIWFVAAPVVVGEASLAIRNTRPVDTSQ